MRRTLTPTLGEIIDKFVDIYNEAFDNEVIHKPLAYSLYTLWKWVDLREVPRSVEDEV